MAEGDNGTSVSHTNTLIHTHTHKAIYRKASSTKFTNDSSVKQDMNTEQYVGVKRSRGLAYDRKE